MRKSIQTIVLDGGTNQSQKREVFKGIKSFDASYQNNQLTLSMELSDSVETETRYFAVYDSRQAIPDKFLPALTTVSAEGITLYIFDVTHDRVSNNERIQELVSFGNFILSKYGVNMPIVGEETLTQPAQVTDADISNWKHQSMGVTEIQ